MKLWAMTGGRLSERNRLTLKNAVFWDVTPDGSCTNPGFGGTYRLHHQGREEEDAGDATFLRNGGSYKNHTA
jgi:hypothetical protein